MRTLIFLLVFLAGLACGRMAHQRSIPAWQYDLARRYPPPATFTPPQYVSPEQERGYRQRQEEVRRASVQLDRMKQDLDRITRSP